MTEQGGDRESGDGSIPVFLLKTKSSPTDAYEELFSSARDGFRFLPMFVPVFDHKFLDGGLDQVRSSLQGRRIGVGSECQYGGLIFTSQRAVEAFSQLVAEGSGVGGQWPYLQDVPVYSVGPATTRALRSIPQHGGLRIYGEHTGNGDALAKFILEHYGEWYKDRPVKPPLLFLVGEQRRDIIPKTLMNESLPEDVRIQVDEIVVYGTGVRESFEEDFRETLRGVASDPNHNSAMRWVVVFSPTGCDSLLRALGLLDEPMDGLQSGAKAVAKPRESGRTTFVATIGPTTRAFLEKSFGLEPEVCSEHPNAEGLWSGITQFITKMR